MLTTNDRLQNIEDALKSLVTSKSETTNEVTENDREYHIKYLKRFIYLLIPFSLFSIISYWFYATSNPLFSTPFAVAYTFIGLLIVLYLDWRFLPGDSIKKISESGIAIGIFWLVIALFYSSGLSVGEKFNPERLDGEAKLRSEKQFDEINKRLDALTPKTSNTEGWDTGKSTR